MKLLFDEDLSFKPCRRVELRFPHPTETGLLGLSSEDDRAVRNAAREGDYVPTTQDADCAEMAALIGPPPKVIWLRCGSRLAVFIADLVTSRSSRHS